MCPEQVSAWEVWAGPELCLKERQETCPGIGCVLTALGDGVFLTSSIRKLMWLRHSHTRAQRDPGPPLHPRCWAHSPDPLQTSHEQLLPPPQKYLALSIAGLHLCPLLGTLILSPGPLPSPLPHLEREAGERVLGSVSLPSWDKRVLVYACIFHV